MSNRRVLEKYYEYANAGQWTAWCDLFTDDMVMDEQLAGQIVGLATLRPMMAGMGTAYAKFQNVPRAIMIDGDEGAVISHISALAAKYPGRAYRGRRHELLPLPRWQDQLHAELPQLEALCSLPQADRRRLMHEHV